MQDRLIRETKEWSSGLIGIDLFMCCSPAKTASNIQTTDSSCLGLVRSTLSAVSTSNPAQLEWNCDENLNNKQ